MSTKLGTSRSRTHSSSSSWVSNPSLTRCGPACVRFSRHKLSASPPAPINRGFVSTSMWPKPRGVGPCGVGVGVEDRARTTLTHGGLDQCPPEVFRAVLGPGSAMVAGAGLVDPRSETGVAASGSLPVRRDPTGWATRRRHEVPADSSASTQASMRSVLHANGAKPLTFCASATATCQDVGHLLRLFRRSRRPSVGDLSLCGLRTCLTLCRRETLDVIGD
jgi:hypothetical protein